jgi:hypothetical protein
MKTNKRAFLLSIYILALVAAFGAHLSAGQSLERDAKRVLLIAGEPSHGYGEHEFVAAAKLLAECLNKANLGVAATLSRGFPASGIPDGIDSVLIYSDGYDQHAARGHLSELRRHVELGGGLCILHWALEPAEGEIGAFLDDTLGGRYERHYSVNPIWTLEHPVLAEHAVTRGVELGAIEDEWYYHLRFAPDVEPLLQADPPLESLGVDGPHSGNPEVRAALKSGQPQTLAWVRSLENGARMFGFSGGHYLFNFSDPDYRRLLLNAAVWTSGADVPAQGVQSEIVPIPRYPSIDQAIARGDIADVRRHIGADPGRVQAGGNPKLTPLQQAILRKQPAIALLLIELGADVDKADGSERTPLHLAVERDLPELITALLAQGADPNRLDRVGWSPLHHAAAKGREQALAALLVGGADPMCLSLRGGTPLHEAAASGSAAMARLLIEHGCDPRHAAQSGVTALDIAREYDNQEVARVLEETERVADRAVE